MRGGHAKTVALLLQSANLAFKPGNCVFMAVYGGHLEVLKLLLDDERFTGDFLDPQTLLKAVREDQVEVVRLLLADPRTNPAVKECLQHCCSNSNHSMLKLLLEDGRFDPRVHGGFCLRETCTRGDLESARLLLKDGRANPLQEGYLNQACIRGDLEIVRLLLEDGRINPNKNYSLSVAAESCRYDIVRLLLKDARVNPNGSVAFENACREGRLEIIKLFLEDGRFDPSSHHGERNSYLRLAEAKGRDRVVRLLLTDSRVRSVLSISEFLYYHQNYLSSSELS